jgi:pimeloyl-ACP methyl ester carboxylesterase
VRRDLQRRRRRRADHRAGLRRRVRARLGRERQRARGKFPGSSLGEALRAVPRSNGTTDLYIIEDRFPLQFAADVPAAQAARMAATQRPVTLDALQEPAGSRPLWKELPSWFVIAEADRNIPADLQRFLAERAGARRGVEIAGASHAVAVSQPLATAELILEAAALPVAT